MEETMVNQKAALKVQRIIWGALLFSQQVYAAIAISGVGQQLSVVGTEDTSHSVIAPVLFGVGLVQMGIGLFGVPLFLKPQGEGVQAYTAQRIVQWAMIEAGLIMGLITVLTGGTNTVFWGLYVLGFLAMLKTFPQGIERESSSGTDSE